MTIKVFQGEREMANDNRLLGTFNLEGIAPAPRGMPQIEVKFDIDANGILNVQATDLGTKKEHKITIQQSSGLSEADIEKMRKDAELHAAEDKKKRELAEARNQAESMCFQMEKLMEEHKDKLQSTDKAPLEAAITKAREAAKGSDVDAIKSAITELEHASHAMSKVLYEAGKQPGAGAAPGGEAPSGEAGKSGGDDDAIDAEFEVKK